MENGVLYLVMELASEGDLF